MEDRRDEDLAASMDASPEILPYLTELVADMWALGSTPHLAVNLFRPLDLPAGLAKLLDLGCGKGALGIAVAKELGYRVLGVDLCQDFLRDAAQRAMELGVSDLCEFVHRDLRDVLQEGDEFDVVVLASLGGVLGRFDRCVGSMRKAVRPGGYMLIDDGFLTRAVAVNHPGYAHLTSYDRAIEYLQAHGDSVVAERIYSVEETRAVNVDYIGHISRRAAGVVERHPEAAEALHRYISSQESECEFIDREITGAIWLLQRG
jgi:ubiquinone/menaquinone biosynthesis C-methylase UbiE